MFPIFPPRPSGGHARGASGPQMPHFCFSTRGAHTMENPAVIVLHTPLSPQQPMLLHALA